MLSGYKTYILAGVAVIAAVADFLIGGVSLQELLSKSWEILFPLIAMALRAGIKTGTGR